MTKQKVIIIGAGPAGLTAGYELLKSKYEVVIVEETEEIGGISKTVEHNGNRMDMGGHRFFSKVPEVNEWWQEMLGKDFIRRERLSRIYFDRKFFDYPISLKVSTLKAMGFKTTLEAGVSCLKSAIRPRPERSLEDFYINRFGEKLYRMFFENYTENLWGRHPSKISPEWGAQRVKGLSGGAIIKDITQKLLKKKDRKVETSLVEEFWYPRLGPGQMWEKVAQEIEAKGGKIIRNAKVVKVTIEEGKVDGVTYEKKGAKKQLKGDYVISSMPIKDLIRAMNRVPRECKEIAGGLPYRDFMTVGVLVPKIMMTEELKDNWIYVHERGVKMGRIQIFNNWSEDLVADKDKIWMGLEYFCNEGDRLWKMKDEAFAKKAIKELREIGLLQKEGEVADWHVERVKKAYPAYFDSYSEIDKLREYLDGITNLFLVGRNGQHRYNNMDHSMCTSFEAVKNIRNGVTSKDNVWNVNTEKEYHEASAS